MLLLLDCCFAASAAPIAGRAITETIAACGWEAIAPAPGRWSFTSALIEVLDEWIDHSFSVAMLHSKVLSVLKHEQPERRGQKKRKVECRRTPVYIHTSAEPGTPSINLSRLRSKESLEDKTKVGVQAASDGQVSSEVENPQNKPDAYSLDGLTSSEPTGNLKVPHVLISLALCEDQELELKACSEWLAAFPALAKYAKVKGVYRSHSTLIIASVPVVIWDLLPENRACSFIGYVTSDNLLDFRETSNAPTAAYSQAVDADDDSKAEHHPELMTLISKPASGVPSSEPTFSTSSVFQPSSSSYRLSEPLVRSLDPPPIEIKSQLLGMGGHSPRLTLTSWSRESTEQNENRTGLDPERRKSLSDLQIPNFKDQEEAQRCRARNMEIEEWRSQVQDSTDIDDEIPKQSSSTLSAPLRYYPFDDIPRIKKDPTEGEDIEPVSDTESVRENQVKDGQVYFNPKATGINGRDRTLMQESRHWNDGPVYPYVIETKIQAQSANDTAKRWNEAADTYSVLSRTATWGTRRRSEPSITDIESIHNGSFLKRFSFKTDKEIKTDREKRAHPLIDSITNMVWKKSDSSKFKRKNSAKEILGRPEAGPFIKQEGRDNLAPPSEPISVHRRGASSPRLNTNLGSSSISGSSHSGSSSVSATASPPKKTSSFNIGAVIRRARSGSNLQHDSSKDGIYGLWKQTGGPPVAKLPFDSDTRPLDFSDTKAGDYSDPDGEDEEEEEPADDGEMIDFDQNTPIIPNFAGFQEHVIALYPSIERTYLVDRIAHQQVVRYKALLGWRVKHQGSMASQNCPAGYHCIALGGSPTLLEPKNQHRDSDASNASAQGLADASDSDSNPEGALAAENFPPGVPMPPAQTLPAEFECQLCFRVKKFQKPSDWTKHVHEDVQPFTCTYANCKELKSFKRKADWVRHENERHRRLSWWTCTQDDCQHKSYRKDNFLQHLVREHKIPEPKQKTKAAAKKARNSDEAIWVMIRNCHHETNAKPQDEPCKFCGKVLNSWKKLTVHLAKHMELISLSVLRLVEQQSVIADTIISPVEPLLVRQAPLTPVDNTDRRPSSGSIQYSNLSASISPNAYAMSQFSSPFYPQALPNIPEMQQFSGVMYNQNISYNTTTTGQDMSSYSVQAPIRRHQPALMFDNNGMPYSRQMGPQMDNTQSRGYVATDHSPSLEQTGGFTTVNGPYTPVNQQQGYHSYPNSSSTLSPDPSSFASDAQHFNAGFRTNH